MTSRSDQVFHRNSLVTTDILCELAHELTVRECRLRLIPIDTERDDETVYTDRAQLIFDNIFEIVSRVLERSCEEVAP